MLVDFDDKKLQPSHIIDPVQETGYEASIQEDDKSQKSYYNKLESDMKFRLAVSFGFLIPLMYISMGHMVGLPLPGFLSGMNNALNFGLSQLLFTLPVLYVNRTYFTKGFSSLVHGSPNMDNLISVGSSAAFVYGIYTLYSIW